MHYPRLMTQWRRVWFALAYSVLGVILISHGWTSGLVSLMLRTTVLALVGTLMFGVFERFPPRLPRWLARWVLQVASIGISLPIATFAIYMLATKPGTPPFWKNPQRLQ